ncbi:isoprenylcysteine carboxylmethyltransferase family protein [Saccharopolyspora sp. NPDC050642]|uniref:methyltransferase family protein n=1 Tax=Saccharopolyspora sp. NPDC050642 TaxID=3157099 RepID=UPI0033DADD94
MPALALTLYLLGLVATFGIRTWLQVRRTGDSGFRRPAARIGSATWWGTVLFAAALVLGAAAPALAVAGILDPLTILRDPVIELLGLVVAVVGFLGVIAAQTGMGSSWRVGVDNTERTALVTGGAFSLVRNPIFTAMIAAFAGLSLMTPTWLQLLGFISLVAAIEIQVRAVEEPYLARVHGAAYTGYAARVGRFLPGIGRGKATNAQQVTSNLE